MSFPRRAAAIAGEKGIATWGQPVEMPPPTADEAAIRLFAEPLIRGALEHRDDYMRRVDDTRFLYEQELRFGTFETVWPE